MGRLPQKKASRTQQAQPHPWSTSPRHKNYFFFERLIKTSVTIFQSDLAKIGLTGMKHKSGRDLLTPSRRVAVQRPKTLWLSTTR
jgi:hypothetical protein